MTSSHHVPYVLGNISAIIDGTKDDDPTRMS